jgi:hypothetical protein
MAEVPEAMDLPRPHSRPHDGKAKQFEFHCTEIVRGSAQLDSSNRPDSDITTPEMKVAWQEGCKQFFYPYGRTYVQTLGEQD